MLTRVVLTTAMNTPHYGGLCTHVLLLQRKLTEHGIEVDLVDGKTATNYQKLATALKAVSIFRNPRAAWIHRRSFLLSKGIKNLDRKANLIHAHDPIGCVAGMGMSLPIVTTIHGPMYEHAREAGIRRKSYLEALREFEQKCFGHTNLFIAVDNGQKEILIQKGVPKQKIIVIYNAVDVDFLRELANSNKPEFEGNYFIMARRLEPKNGPRVAVGAFQEWVGERDVHLLVVGDGTLRPAIEKMIKQHKSGDKVHMMGKLPHERLLPLMKGAIASIVPSVPVEGVIEATSFSALESLAFDVPVIASNIGGLAEIDAGNRVLSLFPAGDRDALVGQLNYWFNLGRNEMGTKLSDYVRVKFGVQQWLDQHLDIYKAVLKD